RRAARPEGVRRRRAAAAEGLPGDRGARRQDPHAVPAGPPDRSRGPAGPALRGDRQRGRGGQVAEGIGVRKKGAGEAAAPVTAAGGGYGGGRIAPGAGVDALWSSS